MFLQRQSSWSTNISPRLQERIHSGNSNRATNLIQLNLVCNSAGILTLMQVKEFKNMNNSNEAAHNKDFVTEAANFASTFPFQGRPYDFLGANSSVSISDLEKELRECLPNVEHLCFLNLAFDAGPENFEAAYNAFVFCWTSEAKREGLRNLLKDLTNKALESNSLIRHPIFRQGLLIMPGQGVPATKEVQNRIKKEEFEKLRYSYLFHEFERSLESKSQHTSNDEAKGEHQDLLCVDVQSSAQSIEDYEKVYAKENKSLVDVWAEYCQSVEGIADVTGEFRDKKGRGIKSIFAFPICVRGDEPPIANVFVATSLGIERSKSRSLLSKIHHWCSYRQTVSLLETERARLYNRVLDQIRHENNKLFRLVKSASKAMHEVFDGFDQPEGEPGWRDRPGEIVIDESDPLFANQDLSSWRIIPYPSILQLIDEIFTLWGNSDDIETIEWSLEGVVNKSIDLAVKGALVDRYSERILESKSIAQVKSCEEHVKQLKAFLSTSGDISDGWQPHKEYERLVHQIVGDIEEVKIAGFRAVHLIRCLYAAIRNSIQHVYDQHSDETKICFFSLPIECKVHAKQSLARGGQVCFSVINRIDRPSELNSRKRIGTKNVIEFSLLPLGGKVDEFGQWKDESNNWFWTTSFQIDTTALSSSTLNKLEVSQ